MLSKLANANRQDLRVKQTRAACRNALTLVELLVVLGIVSVIASLTLMAVMQARESARQVTCRNNLRQIGVAVTSFDAAKKHLPTNGWGFCFLPDAYVDSRYGQPGGWSYQLLPFLELSNVYDLPHSQQTESERIKSITTLISTEIPIYRCPSKSAPILVKQADFPEFYTNLRNPPPLVAGGHYAVNHGTYLALSIRNGGFDGPASLTQSAIQDCAWPTKDECDGVCYVHLKFRTPEITAGLSNVIWAGEKYIAPLQAGETDPGGHDQSFLSGDSRDNRRVCFNPPRSDSQTDGKLFDFGASHPGMMFAVFLDGSTQSISFDVDPAVFRSQGRRLANRQ